MDFKQLLYRSKVKGVRVRLNIKGVRLNIKGVLNPNFRLFSFELKKKLFFLK